MCRCFFSKPKTAYEMRIRDWSSDVCSSDLQPDGGWGEDCATYWAGRRSEAKASSASQTAWALLGLMAAGEVDSDAVRRGIALLQSQPREGARWAEDYWTGTGFPRVFYLTYHGYRAYFPLWALARYSNLLRRHKRRVHHGKSRTCISHQLSPPCTT